MRTRTMLRAVSLGVVVVATLLALVAPAAAGTATGETAQQLYAAGVETYLGDGVTCPPEYAASECHAGVRFRGAFFPGIKTTYSTWWLLGQGTYW